VEKRFQAGLTRVRSAASAENTSVDTKAMQSTVFFNVLGITVSQRQGYWWRASIAID
jgi:hypothetical protein